MLVSHGKEDQNTKLLSYYFYRMYDLLRDNNYNDFK